MKIKELAQCTGLTEKTIRYYEEKGLIVPNTREVGSRRFRDYDQEDARTLLAVATLRRARFRVEEIARMLREPACIPALLREYRLSVEDAYTALGAIKALLDTGALDGAADVYALADGLREPVRDIPLPKADVKLHFKRLDELDAAEKRRIDDAPESRFRFGWMRIFTGRDAAAYDRVRQKLTAAGIPFRALVYNSGTRLAIQGLANSTSPAHVQRGNVYNHGIQAKMLTNEELPDNYSIEIRRRDEEKARRAIRAKSLE